MLTESFELSILGKRHVISRDENGIWITNRDAKSDDVLASLEKLSQNESNIPAIGTHPRIRSLLWSLNHGVVDNQDDLRQLSKKISHQINRCSGYFKNFKLLLPYTTICLHMATAYSYGFSIAPSIKILKSYADKLQTNHQELIIETRTYIAIFELCEQLLDSYPYKKGNYIHTYLLTYILVWYELLKTQHQSTKDEVLPAYQSLLDKFINIPEEQLAKDLQKLLTRCSN